MKRLINGFVLLIAIEHIYFLIIEMFLWNTPFGHRQFKITPDFAEQSAGLAANQGLYNGFLAAGLIWSLWPSKDYSGNSIKVFFLVCIATAGIFGAVTVNSTILFAQALPALIALVLIFLQNILNFGR